MPINHDMMHAQSNDEVASLKGGHSHRRNFCICSQCGRWFRRNKGIHYMMSYGPIHFCNKYCSDSAEFEASLEADVGGCYEPHYYDDAEEIIKECI